MPQTTPKSQSMPGSQRPDFAAAVEARYREIHRQRMADVPILNPAISVEVRTGYPQHGAWLGALITPWFISLVLLPEQPDQWAHLQSGASTEEELPLGKLDFMVVKDPLLGCFKTCSLFSPVQEFASQEAARLAADTAIEATRKRPAEESAPAPTARPEVTGRRGFLTGSLIRRNLP